MSFRILTWHIPSIVGDGTGQGAVYYLDKDYEPVAVRIYARTAPNGGDLQIDIKDDGVSIFENYGLLTRGNKSTDWGEDFDLNSEKMLMAQGSWITLDIPESGGAGDISVSLELISLADTDEVSE